MIGLIFLVLYVAEGCVATTDLNRHELRHIADHLTNAECRKLHESLQMHRFDLDHKVTGKNEPHVPCIVLLQYWDKVESKKSTFQVNEFNSENIGG